MRCATTPFRISDDGVSRDRDAVEHVQLRCTAIARLSWVATSLSITHSDAAAGHRSPRRSDGPGAYDDDIGIWLMLIEGPLRSPLRLVRAT